MANTYLTRTPSGAGNRKTWTWSGWIKRSNLGAQQLIMHCYDGAASNRGAFKFQSNDTIGFDTGGSGSVGKIDTSAVYRDVSAWYHIVVVMDTTNATATDRQRIYVNGVRTTTTVDAQVGVDFNGGLINSANAHEIGTEGGGGSFFNGSMSHIHFIDGTAYDASAFGETDATTGEWKIKTSPSVTYGTNGFFILKDGNSVTDQSGNSNDFTLGGGTLTNTEDSPSNVFDTLNANISQTASVSGRDSSARPFLDNGNTVSSTDVAIWTPQMGSIPITSGKYYYEMRRTYAGSPSNHLAWVGIESTATAGTTLDSPSGTNTNAIAYYSAGSVKKSNSTQSGSWSTWQSNNDIVQVAIDLDNYFIYFGKAGTWQNSGVPTSGSSGTGGIAILAGQSYISHCTVHRGGGSSGATRAYLELNYGNGYFGTTAVSSAGTNASGIGIFEYDVPTGFTALSTKGLNL